MNSSSNLNSSIHTLFGSASAPESSYPSFARSLLLHAVAIALIATLVIAKPAMIPSLRPGVILSPVETIQFVASNAGGGRHESAPASIGVPPPSAPTQIVAPQVDFASHPALPMMMTVLGQPRVQMAGEMGSPTGREGAKSNGLGDGRSIGNGKGNNVGDGDSDYGIPGRNGVSLPRPIFMPDPEYSEAARKAKHQGTVTLWVVLNAQGRIESQRVYRSLGMGLDEQALAAVRTWRFEPATRNGQPIPVQMYVDVSFHLY
ncbi:MAG: TonB-like protein [Acidobacteriales bacterium]|nr:TonB-like protein [Terriglobales bacterium]